MLYEVTVVLLNGKHRLHRGVHRVYTERGFIKVAEETALHCYNTTEVLRYHLRTETTVNKESV